VVIPLEASLRDAVLQPAQSAAAIGASKYEMTFMRVRRVLTPRG
jgi:hypothetical protein